jgi:hypothetical protein
MPRGAGLCCSRAAARAAEETPDMLDTREPLVLHPADNVAILTARAPAGARPLGLGAPLSGPVSSGHKIARSPIPEGGDIVKFGQIIGYATRPIEAGEHVHSHNCGFGAHDQDYRIGVDLAAARAAIPQVDPASFQGYRRANGQVGARNMIAVCATVNCSATVIRRAAEQVMGSGILADYPNVDLLMIVFRSVLLAEIRILPADILPAIRKACNNRAFAPRARSTLWRFPGQCRQASGAVSNPSHRLSGAFEMWQN